LPIADCQLWIWGLRIADWGLKISVRNHERETGIKSSTANSKIGNRQSAIGNPPPLVAIVMGSQSDWDTMRNASETLKDFGLAHECRVNLGNISPQLAADFSSNAEAKGFEVIIAAPGALPTGRSFAANTTLPVLGVPMKSER